MVNFLRKHLYKLAVICIVLLAIYLRFYNFENRWGLAYDQAHDALVARYAVYSNKIPLLGPFSSAGAFQTGGEWYWIVMLGTVLFPISVIAPWIFITVLYIFFVLLIIIFAQELVDKKFALIVGLLVTVSTAQIAQAVSLTNQSPLAIFSLFSIWSAVRFIRTKKSRYIFLLGLSVSTAASIHLQGAALIALVFFTLIFSGRPRLLNLALLMLGLFIPWVPVLIVDMQNNFYNSKNMVSYYLHDQYKISLDVLGRRWLTYLGIFWPKVWSHVVGGNIVFGYLLGGLIFSTPLYKLWRKSLSKEWFVLLFSFFSIVCIIRYTRTPLFDSYIVFLHPFIFLFCGWLIYLIYIKQKIIGSIALFVVILLSLQKTIGEIKYLGNVVAVSSTLQRQESLIKNYPNTKYAVYDLNNKTTSITFPLVLFLEERNLSSERGRRVGVVLDKEQGQYIIFDLQKKTDQELSREGWQLITAERVYLSTEEWYKKPH